jgi:hypothetical protein
MAVKFSQFSSGAVGANLNIVGYDSGTSTNVKLLYSDLQSNLLLLSLNRQTASYTLVLGDANKIVEMNVATANNLIVPLNSSVAFPIGTPLNVSQYGAGQTTIVATSGVTIRSASGNLKIASQYVAVSLVKIGANEWYCFGNLSA